MAEMESHAGITCKACRKKNFSGRRFKCLACPDYDLCAQCYDVNAVTERHAKTHAVQCVLTASDIEFYFGGDSMDIEEIQNYTCPYCCEMGFAGARLLEHITSKHPGSNPGRLCPVCVGLSTESGSNRFIRDMRGHLSLEHSFMIEHKSAALAKDLSGSSLHSKGSKLSIGSKRSAADSDIDINEKDPQFLMKKFLSQIPTEEELREKIPRVEQSQYVQAIIKSSFDEEKPSTSNNNRTAEVPVMPEQQDSETNLDPNDPEAGAQGGYDPDLDAESASNVGGAKSK